MANSIVLLTAAGQVGQPPQVRRLDLVSIAFDTAIDAPSSDTDGFEFGQYPFVAVRFATADTATFALWVGYKMGGGSISWQSLSGASSQSITNGGGGWYGASGLPDRIAVEISGLSEGATGTVIIGAGV